MHLVEKRTDEWFPTEPEARAAEWRAIQTEGPRHNLYGIGRLAQLKKLRDSPLDRSPPYDLVAEHYRAEIRSGRLTVGDELPSVRRIAGEWNIATATAQRTLDLLRSEGWIESRPGRPSVVAETHRR